jgi:hypothetical protein
MLSRILASCPIGEANVYCDGDGSGLVRGVEVSKRSASSKIDWLAVVVDVLSV